MARLTKEVWKDDTGSVVNTIDLTYNTDGYLTGIEDNDSEYAYTYDSIYRLATVSNAGTPNLPTVLLSFGYDDLDRRTSLVASIGGSDDFTNTYAFDSLGRMTSVTQTGLNIQDKRANFAYDAAGRLIRSSVFRIP